MMTIYLRTEIHEEGDPKKGLTIPVEFVEFQPFNRGIDFRRPGEEEIETINITKDNQQFVFEGETYEFCFVYPEDLTSKKPEGDKGAGHEDQNLAQS